MHINVLTDECKQVSSVSEELVFSSETDLDNALKKVIVYKYMYYRTDYAIDLYYCILVRFILI